MKHKEYNGFEVGPIRPPSEHASLLVRVTRNCPWNNCRFCGLYKGEAFSIRPIEHVINDLETIKKCVDFIASVRLLEPNEKENAKSAFIQSLHGSDRFAFHMANDWVKAGMTHVFLQDANTMVIKPKDMITLLNHLRNLFPTIERITSYGRSQTIANIKDEDLKAIADAGLNRIHIGMETGSDTILELVKKGVEKKTQILAGQKVKRAGIELSEYFMPGLGGNEYSDENALETADALNQINPDFIRIRTLAVPERTLLFSDYAQGVFTRTGDVTMVKELYQLIQHLDGITSTIKSDHILNLIPEFEGTLPEDKEKMMASLEWFLNLSDEDQMIYRVGRRTGRMLTQRDFKEPALYQDVRETIAAHNITPQSIDHIVDQLMNRFI